MRDASASVLLAEKEALEGQVVALLDQHQQLSLDLPVRMQHVRFNRSSGCCTEHQH